MLERTCESGSPGCPGAAWPRSQHLRMCLLGSGSEVWSAPAAPIQQAAAFAFGDPPELAERIALSPRLHRGWLAGGPVRQKYALRAPRKIKWVCPG